MLLTIFTDIQFHEIDETTDILRQTWDFIVAQTQLSKLNQSEKALKTDDDKLWAALKLTHIGIR